LISCSKDSLSAVQHRIICYTVSTCWPCQQVHFLFI